MELGGGERSNECREKEDVELPIYLINRKPRREPPGIPHGHQPYLRCCCPSFAFLLSSSSFFLLLASRLSRAALPFEMTVAVSWALPFMPMAACSATPLYSPEEWSPPLSPLPPVSAIVNFPVAIVICSIKSGRKDREVRREEGCLHGSRRERYFLDAGYPALYAPEVLPGRLRITQRIVTGDCQHCQARSNIERALPTASLDNHSRPPPSPCRGLRIKDS